MKTAGVVIDSWKLDIFRAHLDKHGFKYTEHKGPVPRTITLKVETDTVAKLQPIVQAANDEAAAAKRRKMH